MIKSINYNLLSKKSKLKFNILIYTLFKENNFKKIKIHKNGNVTLLKKGFLFFRKGVRKQLIDLLFNDIPLALSTELYNSTDFAKYLSETLLERLSRIGAGREIYKIEDIIDYLHKELELHQLIKDRYDEQIIVPSPNTILVDNQKMNNLVLFKDNLFYIFKGIVEASFRNSVKVARVYTFIFALNALRMIYSPVTQTINSNLISRWESFTTPIKLFFNTG